MRRHIETRRYPAIFLYSIVGLVCLTCTMGSGGLIADGKGKILLLRFPYKTHAKQPERVIYPTKGNIDNCKGTIELWVKTGANINSVKTNQQLVRVEYDKSNVFELYFNATERAFIFFVKDTDTPCSNSNRVGYRVFLVGPKIDWKENEDHHIAITWTPVSERLYIDGQLVRQSFFRGCLDVASEAEGKIIVAGNGTFPVKAIRIWNIPRFPRRISHQPTRADANPAIYPKPKPIKNSDEYKRIDGDDITLYIDKQTAMPIGLVHKKTGRQWFVRAGNISVKIKNADKAKGIITKKVFWNSDNKQVTFNCQLTNKSSKDVWLDVILKLPCLTDELMAFIPADDGIFKVSVGRVNYDYIQGAYEKYGTALPLICLYNEKRNEGITITSGENTYERVDYDLGMQGSPSELQIIHRSLYIPAGGRRLLRWYFLAHAGDWRCSLRKYTELWPGILSPVRGPISKRKWGMIIGGSSAETFLRKMSELGVGWREVSLYLGKGAEFGNYIPDDLKRYRLALNNYRKANAMMQKVGISPMMYIQVRECFDIKMAKKKFKESIKRDKAGRMIVNEYGPFGVSMKANTGSNWYKHICKQAEKILDVFPNADGLFFDNAWSLEYADIMCAVANIAHSRGKSLASNGANWRSVKCSDAIMAESAWYCLGKEQYLGLVKPVVYVPIYGYGLVKGKERVLRAPGLFENLSRDIKACLVAGAFYGFNYRGVKYWPAESIELMKRYVKLQNMLHGRRWILRGHALRLPKNLRGNIFDMLDKNILITLACPQSDLRLHTQGKRISGQIEITRGDSDRKVVAVLLYDIANPNKARKLHFRQKGQKLDIQLSDFTGAGIIRVLCKNMIIDNKKQLNFGREDKRNDVTTRNDIIVVNPKKFGAKGDGITDDTEAFNRLDTYIKSLNCPVNVYIPSGVFMVNPLKTHIRKIGEGKLRKNCLIRLRKDYSKVTCNGEIKVIAGIDYSRNRKVGSEWYWSAVLLSANYCTVDGLNFSGNGTATYRGYDPQRVNIRWQGVGAFGIFKNGKKEYNIGNRIINCSIIQGGGQAIALQYQKHALIANNVFKDSSGAGFSHCEDCILTSNISTKSHDAPYYVNGSKNIIVANNISHKTTNGSGIDVVGSENIIVKGNIIENSAAWGLLVGYSVHRKSGSKNVFVTNNMFVRNCRSPDTPFNAEICIGRPWGNTSDSAKDITIVGNKIIIDGSRGSSKGNFISVAYGSEHLRIANNTINGKTNAENVIITIRKPAHNIVIEHNQWMGKKHTFIDLKCPVTGQFILNDNLNMILRK